MSQITKKIHPVSGGEIEHPDGLCIHFPPQAFRRSSMVKVTSMKTQPADRPGSSIANMGTAFQIACSNRPERPVEVVFAISAAAAERIKAEKGHTFVEVSQGCRSSLVSAPLQERADPTGTAYRIETTVDLPRQTDVLVAPGYLVAPMISSYVAMPHQFKISPLDQDDITGCRRADSADCTDPLPQTLYPACYPAAWAQLYSTYRLVLPSIKRRLEVGTPHTPDPSPDEDGDFFPTWAMGTAPIGAIPQAIPIEDWPGGDPVEIYEDEFPLRTDIPVEDAIRARAELIKRSLTHIVGRYRLPVFIAHSGHAWNVFGIENNGVWSHSQNPDANRLSDWCRWEHADWLEGELKLAADPDPDVEPHASYTIKYPMNCQVKPRNKRLGSLSFSGHYLRFVELADRHNIEWTPYISSARPQVSYLWIEAEVPLEKDGRPTVRTVDIWDDDLGHQIPVPEKDRRDCDCHKEEGCPRCRTRMLVAFWANNLTRDETHHYRVDLYFWTASNRWISMDAAPVQLYDPPVDGRRLPVFHKDYPNWYTWPSPAANEEFTIEATADTTPEAAGREHPFNWRPMAWYIDFDTSHLRYSTLHGIKLVLTCTDPEEDACCVVQDVKQFWFHSLPPSVY